MINDNLYQDNPYVPSRNPREVNFVDKFQEIRENHMTPLNDDEDIQARELNNAISGLKKDINKELSDLDGYIKLSDVGTPSGVAPLNENGKVPTEYLPPSAGGTGIAAITLAGTPLQIQGETADIPVATDNCAGLLSCEEKAKIAKIDNLANKSDIDELEKKIPSKTSELTNDSGFLTQHQDLTGYATEQWVKDQDYLKEHQSLEGYATQEWVESKKYLTDHQSLEGYAKTSDLADKQDKITPTNKLSYSLISDTPTIPSLSGYATEQWVTNQGYLKQHQSLEGYAKTSDLSGKQDKLTAGDNITIENGIISSTASPSVLEQELEVKSTVGGVTEGTVFPTGTPLMTILLQILSGSTPDPGPTPTDGYIYFAITDSPTTMSAILNPGSNEQVESLAIDESVTEYTHVYLNGDSEIPQYYAMAYPTRLGDLTAIIDAINTNQLSNFTKVVDGDYNIYYLGDNWTEDGLTLKFVR